MEEKKLVKLSLLCCIFGLVILYIISRQAKEENAAVPILKAQNKETSDEIQITGNVISIQEREINGGVSKTANKTASTESNATESDMKKTDTKKYIQIKIKTTDVIGVVLFDDHRLPLKSGDQIEVRGLFQTAQEDTSGRKYQPTVLAQEVRVVS
jgi:hypothetical protein